MKYSPPFGESYYRTGNYLDYLGRAEKYRRTAADLAPLLSGRDASVLDFGCGVGHLLAGLRELGFRRAVGCEVSEWAAGYARAAGLDVTVPDRPGRYDVLVCLDVLEHLTDAEVARALTRHPARRLVLRIPVSTDGGKSFHLPVSRADPTHINCKPKYGWLALLAACGYGEPEPIRTPTVYDSDGVLAYSLNAAAPVWGRDAPHGRQGARATAAAPAPA